jgi:hypothetical protein
MKLPFKSKDVLASEFECCALKVFCQLAWPKLRDWACMTNFPTETRRAITASSAREIVLVARQKEQYSF